MKNLITILLFVLFTGCNGQNIDMKETPLISIIKLKSAEAVLNFEEAKKYIDLSKVFKKSPDSKNIEKEWKETITTLHNLGKDKKFTNQFKYFNYSITEEIKGKNAKVNFVPNDKNSNLKKIIYSLKVIDSSWKVTGIDYRD